MWINFGNAIEPKEAKKICKDKGYEVGTERFTDCALELVLENSNTQGKEDIETGLKKDCSNLKGKKLHKYLLCKAGSGRYDDEAPLEVKEKTEETFNEKYNSITDIFKKKN